MMNSIQIISYILKIQNIIFVTHLGFTLILLNTSKIENIINGLYINNNIHIFLKTLCKIYKIQGEI